MTVQHLLKKTADRIVLRNETKTFPNGIGRGNVSKDGCINGGESAQLKPQANIYPSEYSVSASYVLFAL